MREIYSLTSLRFLAAFYVFLFHMHMRFPLRFLPWPVQEFISEGALGVNMFFILSGFILTFNYYQQFKQGKVLNPRQYVLFLVKRLARIYPAYFAGLVLCLPMLGDHEVRSTLDTLWILGLNLTMLNSVFFPWALDWFGGGGWSVATELMFYLLFPTLLATLASVESKKKLVVLFGALALVSGLIGLNYHLNSNAIPFSFSYAFPLNRLPEFVCGIIAALLVMKFGIRIREIYGVLAAALLIGYLSVFGINLHGHVVHNWLLIPTFSILIVALATTTKLRMLSFLNSKSLIYLGKVSYSFYITQVVLTFGLDMLLTDKVLHESQVYLVPGVLLLNIALAVFFYEIIEKKMHRWVLDTYTQRWQHLQPQKLQPHHAVETIAA